MTEATRRPIALVLGGAACMQDDRARALELFTPAAIVCTNGAGIAEPGHFDHWVTMHPEFFPLWLTERRAAGRPDPPHLWCRIGAPVPKGIHCRRIQSWGGSSGLLATLVAIDEIDGLGMDAVCCGVPLDQTPHFHDPKGRPWKDGPNYRSAWRRRIDALRERVKSMSGYTRQLLGEPTAEWVRG